MILKILALTAGLVVAQATIPDQFSYRRAPLRFFFNNQGMRRPEIPWNYQIINGRPVISGFPNGNSYVAFGLNPQTGQIEQTQIITQTRPGGPLLNLLQNMLQVAGQFFGQVTGAFGNAVGGALQSAGQFGQDVQSLTNPVISVTGISQTVEEKEPLQRPGQTLTESLGKVPTAPPVDTLSTSSVETLPDQAKPDFQMAVRTLDQAIISLQAFQTNIRANFQNYFESDEGESAFAKVTESVEWAVGKVQNLRELAVAEPNSALQSGQSTVNTAVDNIESAVVGVAGPRGRAFIEPTRSELNKLFNDALATYEMSVTSPAENSPAK